MAGNEETPHTTANFSITDSIAPTTTSNAVATYNNSATITLSATDNAGGSGVATTYYRVDGGTQTAGTSVTVSTSGSHTLEFWSVDVAGNIETPHKTASFTVADITAPVTVSDALFAYVNSATITLTALDNPGGSGVATTYYRVDGGVQTAGTSVTVSTLGSHTLEFWSVDVAGNVETPHTTANFSITDSIAPTTTSNAVATYNNSRHDHAERHRQRRRLGRGDDLLPARRRRPDRGHVGHGLDAGQPHARVLVGRRGGQHRDPAQDRLVHGQRHDCANHDLERCGQLLQLGQHPVQRHRQRQAARAWRRPTTALDGGAQTAGTSVTVSTLGSHTLEFWSVDVAGNVETPHKTASFTVAADLTAPTTVDNAKGVYGRSPAVIQLTATDTGGSGVAATYYRVDGGTQTFGNTVTITTVGQPLGGVLVGRRSRQRGDTPLDRDVPHPEPIEILAAFVAVARRVGWVSEAAKKRPVWFARGWATSRPRSRQPDCAKVGVRLDTLVYGVE